MIRGFKKLLFLSFIFSVGLVSDTPSIAGMADKYREQNECNWNTAKYESLDERRRYCVNRSGNIYVINKYSGSMYKLDGSFNRTTKDFYGYYSTLTEWKREGNKLIKYSCGTENSSTSPDCSTTMDKDVVAYTLKEAKRRREIALEKKKELEKKKAIEKKIELELRKAIEKQELEKEAEDRMKALKALKEKKCITSNNPQNDFDVKCLQCVKPKYPKLTLRKKITGETNIKVIINRDGLVTNAIVESSAGDSKLDNAALDAARKNIFCPLKVEKSINIEYKFSS